MCKFKIIQIYSANKNIMGRSHLPPPFVSMDTSLHFRLKLRTAQCPNLNVALCTLKKKKGLQ